jgi:hypothetical protein
MTTTTPNTRPSDIVKIIDWCEKFTASEDDEIGSIKDMLKDIAKEQWEEQFACLIGYCYAVVVSEKYSLVSDTKNLFLARVLTGLSDFIDQHLDFLGVKDKGVVDELLGIAFAQAMTSLCPNISFSKALEWVKAESGSLYSKGFK